MDLHRDLPERAQTFHQYSSASVSSPESLPTNVKFSASSSFSFVTSLLLYLSATSNNATIFLSQILKCFCIGTVPTPWDPCQFICQSSSFTLSLWISAASRISFTASTAACFYSCFFCLAASTVHLSTTATTSASAWAWHHSCSTLPASIALATCLMYFQSRCVRDFMKHQVPLCL